MLQNARVTTVSSLRLNLFPQTYFTNLGNFQLVKVSFTNVSPFKVYAFVMRLTNLQSIFI